MGLTDRASETVPMLGPSPTKSTDARPPRRPGGRGRGPAGAASGAAWAVSGAYSLQNRRTQLVCPAAAFGIGGQFRSVDTGMPQRGLAC